MVLATAQGVGTKFTSLVVALAPALAMARPDLNAYLNYSVNSTAGLVAEVKHDPAVADRFMRHFGMSKADVIVMLSKLHVEKLQHDTAVTMFSVPVDGAIRSHHAVLRKGERVFVDADGNLVLKLKCGNPLVGGRELTAVPFAPATVETSTPIRSMEPELVQPTVVPTDMIAEVLPPDTVADITTPVVPEQKAVETITNNNITNNTTYATGGGGSNGIAGLLVAVPIAAFLGSVIDRHGNCCCPPPAPTPEPVSMTLLAGSVVGLSISRKRRRS